MLKLRAENSGFLTYDKKALRCASCGKRRKSGQKADGRYSLMNICGIILRIFGAAALSAVTVNAAYATACSITMGNMSFGTVSSISSSASTSGKWTVTCRNAPSYITDANALPLCVSVFPVDSTDAAVAQSQNKRPLWLGGDKSGNNFQMMKFDFTMLDYRDCSGCSWGGGGEGVANYGAGYAAFAQPKRSLTVSGTIGAASAAGQTILGGSYSGDFRVRLNWNDTASGDGQRTPGGRVLPSTLCSDGNAAAAGTQSQYINLHVDAAVKSACSLKTVQDIAFLKNYSLNLVKPETGEINLTCSGKMNYEIGVSKGNWPDSSGARNMKCQTAANCQDSAIQYQLFQDAGYSLPWNDTWGTGGTYKGSFSSGGSKNIPVYARIAPGQATPPPGTYGDTVIITVLTESAQ